MKKPMKALYIASWVLMLLFQTFPLIMLTPFTGWSWWYLLPVGIRFLGLIMVPLGLKLTDGKMNGIFWLWGNDEEGCPGWWLDKMANLVINPEDPWYQRAADKLRKMFPRFWWYAIRNGIGNFRFLFKDYPLKKCNVETDWNADYRRIEEPMEAANLIKYGRTSAYMWVSKGWKAGYRRVWLTKDGHYSERWYGWKVGGETVPGCGFTWQRRNDVRIGD